MESLRRSPAKIITEIRDTIVGRTRAKIAAIAEKFNNDYAATSDKIEKDALFSAHSNEIKFLNSELSEDLILFSSFIEEANELTENERVERLKAYFNSKRRNTEKYIETHCESGLNEIIEAFVIGYITGLLRAIKEESKDDAYELTKKADIEYELQAERKVRQAKKT